MGPTFLQKFHTLANEEPRRLGEFRAEGGLNGGVLGVSIFRCIQTARFILEILHVSTAEGLPLPSAARQEQQPAAGPRPRRPADAAPPAAAGPPRASPLPLPQSVPGASLLAQAPAEGHRDGGVERVVLALFLRNCDLAIWTHGVNPGGVGAQPARKEEVSAEPVVGTGAAERAAGEGDRGVGGEAAGTASETEVAADRHRERTGAVHPARTGQGVRTVHPVHQGGLPHLILLFLSATEIRGRPAGRANGRCPPPDCSSRSAATATR